MNLSESTALASLQTCTSQWPGAVAFPAKKNCLDTSESYQADDEVVVTASVPPKEVFTVLSVLKDLLPHEFLFVLNAVAVVHGCTMDPDHPSQLPVPVTGAVVVVAVEFVVAWRSLAAAVA